MVLAGGEGKRLMPLTAQRAKPAVPFGGHYRLIDFPLSNLANGGYRKMVVLTQYKSHSLDVHIARTWRLSAFLGNYVTSVPAQMRRGPRWFLGSADALYQNLNIIEDELPDYIFVFGADHIYRMDPRPLLDAHIESGAGVTVAGIRIPVEDASAFGIIETSPNSTRIAQFLEKPSEVDGLADDPTMAFASMGNYVFNTETLVDILREDAGDDSSNNDIGGDIIPKLVDAGTAHVYDFTQNRVPGVKAEEHYWRDVGTIDAYHEATMDLVGPDPMFDLYNNEWPIHTAVPGLPPAKVLTENGQASRVHQTLLCNGVVVAGAELSNSVVSGGADIGPGAQVENSILLNGVRVGANAVIKNAIIDKNVVVPAGQGIGVDGEYDHEHFSISPGGIVTVAKGQRVPSRPV